MALLSAVQAVLDIGELLNSRRSRRYPVHFIVGLKLSGALDHMVVDAEDALAAALKVKTESPKAMIMYVRPQNRRGDARNPSHGLAEANH